MIDKMPKILPWVAIVEIILLFAAGVLALVFGVWWAIFVPIGLALVFIGWWLVLVVIANGKEKRR